MNADSGLFNERTTMAWHRTALALVAVGAFVARQTGSFAAAVVVLVAVMVAAASIVSGAEQRHQRREDGEAIATLRHNTAVTAAVTALSATSLLIIAA